MSQGGILQGIQQLQRGSLINEGLKTALAKEKDQNDALGRLYGSTDAKTGITWDPISAPTGKYQTKNDDTGEWETRSLFDEQPGSAPSAAAKQAFPSLLNSDVTPANLQQNLAQSFADQRGQLMRRASPETFLAQDLQRQMTAPWVASLPEALRPLAAIAPAAVQKAQAERLLPGMTDVEKELLAAGIDPKSPKGLEFLAAKRAKDTYISDNNALNIEEKKAGIAEKNASAAKTAAQTEMLKSTGLDEDTMERVYQGTKTGQALNQLIPNLGRGQQGANQIIALQNYITRRMSEDGFTEAQKAAARVNLNAQGAAAKRAAERGAGVDMGAYELDAFADQVTDALKGMNEGSFVPWNKLSNMADSQISDPKLAAYKTALQGLKGAYSTVISRGGVPTVEAQHKADDLINAATGPSAVAAIIKQMKNEATAVHGSSSAVQDDIQRRVSGNVPGQGGASSPAAGGGAAPLPPAAQPKEGDTATNKQTGARLVYRQGQWVPLQ